MLVATFAISYLLQSIALVRFGAIGKIIVVIPKLSEPVTIAGVHIRWITIVTILLAIGVFAALTLLLTKTTIGLQMRAASIDSQTARLLGVRANAVIMAAVVVSGLIAAIVAVILPMAVPERLLVAPDRRTARDDHRPRGRGRRRDRSALVGDAGRVRNRVRRGRALRFPAEQRLMALHEQRVPGRGRVHARDHRPSPAAGGSLRAWSADGSGAGMRRVTELAQLLGPVLVLVLVGVVGSMSFVDAALANEFRGALVSVAIVVALYVFVGNSGVISFGHVSFVAVGAFAAGVMTIPVELKPTITPGLFSLLGEHSAGNVASLALAAVAGGVFALLVGIPLMRLSGLSAGIATFAVLGVTYNIFNNWTKIGPGPLTLTTVPETTDFVQATAEPVGVVTIAFSTSAAVSGGGYAPPARIRLRRDRDRHPSRASLVVRPVRSALRASRGLLVHLAGTLQARDVYLDLTFLTLAMLVVGGVGSLWGAVVGALAVSALDTFLLKAESGEIGFVDDMLGKPLWGGSRLVGVAAFMAIVLVVLPNGLTRGREFRLPRFGHGCDPAEERGR